MMDSLSLCVCVCVHFLHNMPLQDGDLKFSAFDFRGNTPVPSHVAAKKPKLSLQQALKKVCYA